MQMSGKTIPWWRKALAIALGGFRSGFGLFPRAARPEPVTETMILSSSRENREVERTLTEPSSRIVTAPAIPAEVIPAAEPIQATIKGREASKKSEKHLSGAKAPIDPRLGLKPIPFKEASISSDGEAQPEPGAEAAPLPDAGSDPVSESVAVPTLRETPDAEAVNEVVEEPVTEPAAAPQRAPEAVAEALPEPVNEPEPLINAEPEPATEPEPAAGPVPASEPVPVPDIEPVAQAAETAIASAIEPVAPVAEPPAEPVLEPVPEPNNIPVLIANAVPRRVLKPQPNAEEKEAARLAARQKKLDEGSEESPFSVIVGQVYDGPLDLLLDLIRKQDIDIYDIPIAIITSQFLAYVNQLRASDVDVAGDFIYTASLLIHIKSKMLLPHTETGPEAAAEDPRRELVERLLEHERFKNAAQMLQQKQMLEAATWSNPGAREFKDDVSAEPEIAADTVDLVRIFREILERARNRPVIDLEEDSVTVGQMIQFLARRLTMEDRPIALRRLLSHTHSERALIAMFLALLEMVRLQAILLRQDRQFSEIFIKKHNNFDIVMNEGLGNARDDWR
jgi:segregation and condensation protein A